MDKRLKKLIVDYQAMVRHAVELIHESGIPLPITCGGWIETAIPGLGELKGGVRYWKHGFGCKVSLPTGTVDFDFGRMGEIDGFDSWRLSKFAEAKHQMYGFESSESISAAFDQAVLCGEIFSPDYGNHYLRDSKRLLAAELCKDIPGDLLPHYEQDKIIVLHTHSFLIADFMRRKYDALSARLDKKRTLSASDELAYRAYFSSWLGYLRASCEGFQQLRVRNLLTQQRPGEFLELVSKSDEVGRTIRRHEDSLREFRNNVFHLRADIKPILQFAIVSALVEN